MSPLLLDTHAVIWLFEDISLAPKAMAAIEAAHRNETPLLVSPITAVLLVPSVITERVTGLRIMVSQPGK